MRSEVLVLGIGNLLWADEGFGVRAVEALHAAYEFPAGVTLLDGGTLGLMLYEPVATARRVLVFDAIDFGLPPGTLRVLRDDEVPAWGRTKLSPHQTSFNDVLALAQMNGRTPDDDRRDRRAAGRAERFRRQPAPAGPGRASPRPCGSRRSSSRRGAFPERRARRACRSNR